MNVHVVPDVPISVTITLVAGKMAVQCSGPLIFATSSAQLNSTSQRPSRRLVYDAARGHTEPSADFNNKRLGNRRQIDLVSGNANNSSDRVHRVTVGLW